MSPTSRSAASPPWRFPPTWETGSPLAAALQRFGTPSILVNNSGGPPPVDVTAVDPNLWRQQFEIMVLNQMRLTEAVLPAMRQARFGRILSVASTSIVEPIPVLAVSNALRAALANWMKTLAGEVAQGRRHRQHAAARQFRHGADRSR